MGRIYKRGRIWYLDVAAGKRRIRRRVGTSKKIAELALRDAEVKAARDEFGFAKNDIGVETFLERFLEHSGANHQPNTTTRYRAVIDHFRVFLKDKFPNVGFLSQITPEIIDRYKVARKDAWVNPNGDEVESEEDVKGYTRRGARAHTINFEVGVLKTIFNLAIKWGYLKENPTSEVTKLKVTDAKPVRFLTVEECQQLLESSPADLYPIFFTYLNSGMRKAELENLEWEDIDFKRRKIKIRHKEFWQPKTGEREIPISQSLYDILESLKDQNNADLQSNFVFPHSDGGRIRVKLREKLIAVAKQAGIENFTKLHTLRHTFASHLVMSGVDLPTVKKLMGHSDIQTTMIYAHLAPAVDRLAF
jgi:integrase